MIKAEYKIAERALSGRHRSFDLYRWMVLIPSFPSTDPLPEITWRKPFQFTYEVDIKRYPPFLICPRAGRGPGKKSLGWLQNEKTS